MLKIEANFRIVTPMFIGGADQSPSDGIRPSSLKGALRFWWRALNWGRFWRDNGRDTAAALRALHKEEARLFGAAADEKAPHSGQGSFLLSIAPDGPLGFFSKTDVHPQFSKYDASRYLGYGVMEAFSSRKTGAKAGQLIRGCLNENQTFTARLVFREQFDASVMDALIAFGLLGGLGSRARRGMGSVALERITEANNGAEIWSAPRSRADYVDAVVNLLRDRTHAPHPAPYSAFGQKSRVDMLMASKTPYDVLNSFGRAMVLYRSWGKDNEVLGQPSERRFTEDHAWYAKENRNNFHPRRVVFGLPHNYGKTKDLAVGPEHHERRGSPLLFHVHHLPDNSFLGVSAFLPSSFLPQEECINAGGKCVVPNIEWEVIIDFLDGVDKKGSRRFPGIQTLVGGLPHG